MQLSHKMHINSLVIVFLCIMCNIDAAQILGVFHYPSPSHHILGTTLLKALAARGHQVTMVSPYPSKHTIANYTDIELTGIDEHKEELMQNLMNKTSSTYTQIRTLLKGITVINDKVLNHPKLKELLRGDKKFDLIILVCAHNEAFLGIGHHFNAPTILFSTFGASPMINSLTQNPAPFSYIPSLILSYPSEMTFLQRVSNTITLTIGEIFYHNSVLSSQQTLLTKHFPNAAPLYQLMENVSLVLLNTHYSLENPKPYVPSIISIGGFHIKESEELTGELKDYLDSAKEGFLFLSLGSNLQSSDLSIEKLEVFLKTFEKLPLKIIWKFEAENLTNKPKNVRIEKWLPQQGILAHPNIKVFVSHGGLLSTTEAVYHGVPVVGIPMFADQTRNVVASVNNGYAIHVDFSTLSEVTLTNAINEILNNTKYIENVKKRSSLLREQPVKPLDNAIFWIEHVLKYKSAPHLKTAALKLSWYQYYLLDVAVFLLAILSVVFILIKFMFLKAWRFFKNKLFLKKQKYL